MWSHHFLRCLSDPPAVASSTYQTCFIHHLRVDEWSYDNCIHGHGEQVTLGGDLSFKCNSPQPQKLKQFSGDSTHVIIMWTFPAGRPNHALSVPTFGKLRAYQTAETNFLITWQLTTCCWRLTILTLQFTKAVSRLFFSVAISWQLNAAPYLCGVHKSCPLLIREETMPVMRIVNSRFCMH